MKIPSRDIPQADNLDDVVRTVDAVAAGASTYEEIADAIEKVERQGRYYRRAAEILGFIRNDPGQNRSVLTPMGREFLRDVRERERLLAEAVFRSRLVQRVIPLLETAGDRGVSRDRLQRFIAEVTDPVGATMIPRRVSTVVSWLERIRMVAEEDGRYKIRRLPADIEIVQYDAADEPLAPRRYSLETYNDVAVNVRNAQGYISVLIDDAARERAEESHRVLTNLVAGRIRDSGAIPKSNRYVDLSAVLNDSLYLFEMKSTTNDNVHAQIRRAISQLYEYRYLQQVPDAKLVVVIENPPPQEKRWIVDYVVKDRQLLIAWDGDGRSLHCPADVGRELRFLTQ